jgi:signal transduction histidine kinase/Tfp pilus assembly protein PilF
LNRIDESAQYYKLAAEIEKKELQPNLSRLSSSYGNTGYCYRESGRFNEAAEWYQLAIESAILANDSSEIAAIYINLGNLNLLMGRFGESVGYFTNALRIDKLRGNLPDMANDYSNLGKVFDAWGRHAEAIGYYKQALDIGRTLNHWPAIAVRLSNIGASFQAMQQHDSAKWYFSESLKTDSVIKQNPTLLKGKAFSIDQYARAESYFHSGLGKQALFSNPRSEAIKMYELGIEASNKGYFGQASQHFLKSLNIANSIGLANLILDNKKALSETFYKKGNYKKAFDYFNAYALLRDSVFTAESRQSLNEFHVLYQTEKKDHEIQLLNSEKEIQNIEIKRVRQQRLLFLAIALFFVILLLLVYRLFLNRKRMAQMLAEKNEALHKLNSTKDKFISIISHDLRNPFSAFSNISAALNAHLDTLDKSEVRYYIKELHDSSVKMNAMLKALLDWAGLQKNTTKLQSIDVNIHNCVALSLDFNQSLAHTKNIALINNIPKNIIIKADPNALTTVFNNIIGNAIKFSEPGKKVIIEAPGNTNNCAIQITDEGIGMTNEDLQKLFRIDIDTRSIGKHEAKGTGMGLILCSELVEKMNGRIFVESEPQKGTRFIIRFMHKAVKNN